MSVEEWQTVFMNAGSFIVGLVLACGQLYTVIKMKQQERKEAEKEKSPKNYGKNIKAENAHALNIQKEIEELRQILNADRVQIMEFHNGTDFSTRKGYKMDCTYETIRYGNESIKSVIQNYPTTMLPIFMNNIIENKQYFVQNISNIAEKDMSTYAMKVNMHIAAFYDMVLENSGNPIGILAVQFTKPRSLKDDEIAIIHAKKIVIEELLK